MSDGITSWRNKKNLTIFSEPDVVASALSFARNVITWSARSPLTRLRILDILRCCLLAGNGHFKMRPRTALVSFFQVTSDFNAHHFSSRGIIFYDLLAPWFLDRPWKMIGKNIMHEDKKLITLFIPVTWFLIIVLFIYLSSTFFQIKIITQLHFLILWRKSYIGL